MSLILNIDTALDSASLCLGTDGSAGQTLINENQKDHAAWLHPAISQLLKENRVALSQLQAVAVSIGPGSYTGLRVGLAAAKGLCYALQIPLITISTLAIIAHAVKEEASDLICPLIDARRMEVFAAVYTRSLEERIPAHALLVDEHSFAPLLLSHKILFCGNGSIKLKPLLLDNLQAGFSATRSNAADLASLAGQCFENKEFADSATAEPLYIKEFYTPAASGK